MNTNSIIIYESKESKYTQNLNKITSDIRMLNEVDIKYRSSFDRRLTGFQSNYLEKGKWIEFILTSERSNIEELISDKLKITLFLFWREIINKLDSDTIFKLQLKLSLRFSQEQSEEKESSQIRSMGSVRLFKKENFDEALSYFKSSLFLIQDNYSTFYINNIILTYNICYEDSILNNLKLVKESLNELIEDHSNNMSVNKNELKISDKNLPLTTDLTKWGEIKIIKGSYPYPFNLKETKILITNDTNSSEKFNYIVSIRGLKFNDKKILIHRVSLTDKNFKYINLNFIDIIYDINNLNSFVRMIDNTQYVYDNGVKVLTQKRKKAQYFTTTSECKSLTENFITMDLETKDTDGILVPYCVSIFDGKNSHSFYITDYSSSDEMLKASILFILRRKYNKHRIYLHNFSYFDGIFLMRIISSVVDCQNIKPVIRDGRIINLRVEFESENNPQNEKNKSKYYVEFRDSYLLLTTSLEKLGKTFAKNEGKFEKKLPFPFRFVNESYVDYNYIGPVPAFKYYEKINEIEYNQLINNMKTEGKDLDKLNLQDETIIYWEQDCKTLYYVLKEFSKLIYLEFGVDIVKTPTVSSLAFRIYRVKYLEKDNIISMLHGSIYNFIYQSYYGGAVDAYVPVDKNIKSYDVNSLYPTSMRNNSMPVGNPYYFEGNLDYFNLINFNYPKDLELNGDRKNKIPTKTIYSSLNEVFNIYYTTEFIYKITLFLNLNKDSGVLSNKDNLPYGFFEVDLITPPKNELNEPILLKRHNTKNGGHRTIAPVGKWKGVYY